MYDSYLSKHNAMNIISKVSKLFYSVAAQKHFKNILLVLLMFFSMPVIHAQSKGFAGFFTIGYNNVSNAGQKLQLMLPGMEKLTNNYYGIGGEAYWKSGKLILGAQAGIYAHGVVSNGEKHAEPFSANGMIKGGYIIIENRDLFIYPTVGGGIAGTVITSYEKNGNLKSALHSIYLISPAIDFAINLDPIIYRFTTRPASGVFISGVRTGYRLSKKSDYWKRVNDQPNQKISFANNGFYASMAFGIGYFDSSK